MALTAAPEEESGATEREAKRVISLVNIGTKTATPKGAAKSLKSP